MIYLDTSVLVPLFRVEARTARVNRLLTETDEGFLVSDFAIGEFGATMARLVRTNELEADDASDRLGKFDVWTLEACETIATEARDIRHASLLVRQYALELRLPDAVHIAVVQRTGSRLATADRRLFGACQQIDCEALLIA